MGIDLVNLSPFRSMDHELRVPRCLSVANPPEPVLFSLNPAGKIRTLNP